MSKLFGAIIACLLLFCQEAIVTQTKAAAAGGGGGSVNGNQGTTSESSSLTTPGSSSDGSTSTTPGSSSDGSTSTTPGSSSDGSTSTTPGSSSDGSTSTTPGSSSDGSTSTTPGSTSTPSECPVNVTAEGGSVILPSALYPANKICNWKIEVPKEKRVILTFKNFQLPDPCNTNYLQISEEDPNIRKTILCGDERPHAQTTQKNVMNLQFRSHTTNGQAFIEAAFVAGEPAKFTKVTLLGLVYDDGEPEEWEEELKNKNSKEWKELQEELCETVSEALESQPRLYDALTTCALTKAEKVRVRNVHDGEDDDDDDKDDNDGDKDDNDNDNDSNDGDNDNDGSSNDNDNGDKDEDSDDGDDSKNKLGESVKQKAKVRPSTGELMDGVEATLDLMFDQSVASAENYTTQNIEKLISTKGAQNGTSSFGRNIGKDYPNGGTRLGYLSWIVGLLTIASLLC